ncbi:MAG: hypothetical protein GM48_3395 [actinobacterium acIB-AMD-7]|nr:MAG: hypothetical protein GM48_3395 [actinobacterium acIB-AMD-7]
MAEAGFNRLKGNVDRIERAISTAKRSLNTNKKFAEGVDYSEELRAKSLRNYKLDQKELEKLQEDLKQANTVLKKFVAEERSKKGQEKAKLIEGKYAKLQEALGLQLDPTSAAAKKIKDDMDALVDDYKGALTSINKRAVNKIEARAELTKTKVPGFESGTSTGKKPSVVAGPKPEVKPGALTKTPLPNTGGKTKPGPGTPGATVETPAVTPGGGITDSQNAARLIAEGKAPTGVKTPLDTLLAKTEFWYDLPDYIFNLDTKLGELLVEAVAGGWDNEKFLAKAKLTPWWQKNADSVRTKIVNREKYNDLLKAGEDVKNTEYGMYLGKQVRSIKAQAKDLADVTLTDAQAQSIAQKIYDGNLEDDPLAINSLIVPFIGKTTSIVGNGLSTTGFGGQALQNYQTLQGIAKANGFALKDILPNVSAITAGGDLETAVLRGLADGSIDINRVAQDARMLAAQGQPQYVRGLLGQGYDLEAIYAPYRQTMASTLELDPNQIDLNDNTLRMAITDKGDMNLYDFKKALRQDNRWQYTGAAKEEVSNAALKVLQDFGFQG